MKKQLLILVLIFLNAGCKSTKNIDKNSIELKITDYNISFTTTFNLELKNNSKESIFILKSSSDYNGPEFFELNYSPLIESNETIIVSLQKKPVSEIIEIKPKSKLKFKYLSESFPSYDAKGKIIEFQISYSFDYDKEEYIDKIKYVYKDDVKAIKAYSRLTKLNIKSEKIRVKIPK